VTTGMDSYNHHETGRHNSSTLPTALSAAPSLSPTPHLLICPVTMAVSSRLSTLMEL
jgi:hypothetical protein